MGPQLIKTLMTLFREVPAADLGILTDRPDAHGLQYRARTDLYSPVPVLTLDSSREVIAEPFRPFDADQHIINEGTVEPLRGASFGGVAPTGPRSYLSPPDSYQQ